MRLACGVVSSSLFSLILALSGCAAPAPCVITPDNLIVGFDPAPGPGLPNHSAAAPGNQAQLQAIAHYTSTGDCSHVAVSNLVELLPAQWTSSDPKNITIDSSAPPANNGRLTCTGATNGPATITGTYVLNGKLLTGTTTITCY